MRGALEACMGRMLEVKHWLVSMALLLNIAVDPVTSGVTCWTCLVSKIKTYSIFLHPKLLLR